MAHRWIGNPTISVDECQDCHVLSYKNAIYTADTYPCEHIWRPVSLSNAYVCDCGNQVSFTAMLSGAFNWSCPIVGGPVTSNKPRPQASNAVPAAYTHWPTPMTSSQYTGVLASGDLDLGRPVRETKTKDKYPRCRACDRELCADLDAYYGVDPALMGKCDPCRRRKS